MSVSKILAHRRLWYVLQNYQNFIEMTSNMIDIVAFGGGLKFPHKIHLNTVARGGGIFCPPSQRLHQRFLRGFISGIDHGTKNLDT